MTGVLISTLDRADHFCETHIVDRRIFGLEHQNMLTRFLKRTASTMKRCIFFVINDGTAPVCCFTRPDLQSLTVKIGI